MQGILLGLGLLMFISARVLLIVRAFRTSVGWGLAAWWLPFGSTIFAFKYPDKGRGLLLCMLGSGALLWGLLMTNPSFTEGFKRGYAAGRQRAEMRRNGQASGLYNAGPTHEVRDLAENEPVVPAATPAPPDPYAVQRSVLAKHGADLLAEYQRLDAERAKLKPGAKASVAAFNAKAAHYQSGLKALQTEQAQLAVLDHPGTVAVGAAQAVSAPGGGSPAALNAADAAANAALLRLQTSVSVGNYAGFAASLRKCLADYRRTAVFPQITAYAQRVLRDAPPTKLRRRAATAGPGRADGIRRHHPAGADHREPDSAEGGAPAGQYGSVSLQLRSRSDQAGF